MKKFLLSTFIIIFMQVNMYGQEKKYTTAEFAALAGNVDSLMYKYINSSQISNPNEKKVNPLMIATLRNIISPNATIFDDINPEIKYDAPKVYNLVERSRNEFLDGMDKFPNGFAINVKGLNLNYDIPNGKVKVALSRFITGISSEGQNYSNLDTLLITLAIDNITKVSIISIEQISSGNNFKVTNDNDLDGFINELDDCPNQKGLQQYNGCADDDGDGVLNDDDACPKEKGDKANAGCLPTTFTYKFVFSGYAGYQYNQISLSFPEFKQVKGAYTNLEQTKQYDQTTDAYSDGKVDESPYALSPCFGANIAYFFGKGNKNQGLSLGVYYTQFNLLYNLSNAIYTYRDVDASGAYHHRTDILLPGSSERIKYNLFEFPVLYRYKKKFNRFAAEVYGGPAFMYIIPVSSNPQIKGTTYSYYDETGGNNLGYLGAYNTNSATGGFTTNASNTMFGASANGFNVLLDNTATAGYYAFNDSALVAKSATLKSLFGVALHAGVDLFWHFQSNKAFKIGLQVNYSFNLKNDAEEADGYKMFNYNDNKVEYNSFFNSKKDVQYSSYGINAGIIIGIKSKKK